MELASSRSMAARSTRALAWPADLPRRAGLPDAPAGGMDLEIRAGDRPLLVNIAALENQGLVIGMADLSRIEAAQQAREDTLRFVTHDLRAPLASVISLIDAPPPGIDLPRRVRGIAASALGLIDDLFRLSRAEAMDPAAFTTCDLVPVTLDAIELCWAQARSARVTLDENTADFDEALTRGNRELLHRALANLLSNAIKYGGDDRRVEIRLTAEGDFWRVAVRDHGPGIPPEERSGLFKRFSRLPGAIRRGLPGSGLGLLMVRTVAERHGGRVEADFPPDGGSRFSLLLPRVHG
ncbi:MAG: HAMP domain-containing sensor histidine kinase [Candidatus Dactylopiibacterium sp.]|nr:HAMP domain-containing sensor histidine kinase [Candidatus Dactylopiibacterium sp.]